MQYYVAIQFFNRIKVQWNLSIPFSREKGGGGGGWDVGKVVKF